jgi:hypothetical protein
MAFGDFIAHTILYAQKLNDKINGLANGSGDDDVNKLSNLRLEALGDFVVYPGGLITQPTTGKVTFSALTAYIGGVRYSIAAPASPLSTTSSSDNYVDVSGTTGLGTVTAVATGGTAPALASGRIRLGYMTTNSSNNIISGGIVQSGIDSNSVPIYPTGAISAAQIKEIGKTLRCTTALNLTTTYQVVPGLSFNLTVAFPCILEAICFLDMDMTSAGAMALAAELVVDGTAQPGQILLIADNSTTLLRSTVGQTWDVPLAIGSHTITINAANLTTNASLVNASHSSLRWRLRRA